MQVQEGRGNWFQTLVLHAKQGWWVLKNPNTTRAKVFKACHYPRASLLEANVGYTPSFTWRSIPQSLWVLERGGYWRMGLCDSIHI